MKLAANIYIQNEGKTLMLYRNKKENDYHEGIWNGLGGKFEKGESPEDCAIREAKEESGLDIIDPILKGVLTAPDFNDGEDWYIFLFVATQFKGEVLGNPPEGELHWIDNDKLLELNLWEGDKIFFPHLFKPGTFSVKNYYEGRKLLNSQIKHYE